MNLTQNKNNILISSSVGKTIRDSAQLAQSLGVGLEISRLPLCKSDTMTVEDNIDFFKNVLENFSNKLTVHAMFSDVNIASGDWELRNISQKRFIQSFEIAKAIGADTILFHTGNKGTKHEGSIYKFKSIFTDFWLDFIREFEKADIIAVIENVFETEPDFCLDLYNRITSDNFKLALDTGHVNLYAPNTKITDWIKRYGHRLYHMHIHNNFGLNDDHSNLLNGTINFNEIFECLEQQNLNPSMVLEMYSEEDIFKSLDYMYSL